MIMPIVRNGSVWGKKDPAGVYEDSKKDAEGLGMALDQKMMQMACRRADIRLESRFWAWARQERHQVMGIIFQANELLDCSTDSLDIIVVTDQGRALDASDGMDRARIMGFSASIFDSDGLHQEISDVKPSGLRARLSGELLVAGRDRFHLDFLIGSANEAQVMAEYGGILRDIARMLASDIRNGMGLEAWEKPCVGTADFRGIAVQAMEKRGIHTHIQKKLLLPLRRAVCY